MDKLQQKVIEHLASIKKQNIDVAFYKSKWEEYENCKALNERVSKRNTLLQNKVIELLEFKKKIKEDDVYLQQNNFKRAKN